MSYGYGTKTTAYLEADIMSRPKEWLIPLLYEHLLSSLRRAAVQIEANDITGRTQSLDKASAIVLELSSSLNREEGGQIAAELSSLYAFFVNEILQIGLTRDLARLQKLSQIVAELLDAWTQAAEQVSPRNATRPVTASAA
jgi:flagellar secretion chaperone FliS